MYGRQPINALAVAYRGNTVIGQMRLVGSILKDGTVVGTVQKVSNLEHPLGHPVPARLVMERSSEPKIRMLLSGGRVIEFHIGTTLGVVVDGRVLTDAAAQAVVAQRLAGAPRRTAVG